MGNSRRFDPSRRSKVLGLKEQLREAQGEAAFWRAVAQSQQEQLDRLAPPPDIEEWVQSILPDMDEEEREQWNAMTASEQEDFIAQLGVKISASKAALDTLDGHAPEVADPEQ